ncbi:hypothetical protein H696_01080 [Fonticula alba]|uniref:50S ribosomal protein L22 n=1 Tax=Fonticula alba TaxID=691883 RepID=A0A058ZB90_FONAL|nr:hypothetical protein H696_01080 [Fonticula alba]KCV71664.1 hypothetical protein H696_01080 [Fonticula alba]|eukprot:XP_009493242.1 hypothetical protein H696_01080 [Fonticula alba]
MLSCLSALRPLARQAASMRGPVPAAMRLGVAPRASVATGLRHYSIKENFGYTMSVEDSQAAVNVNIPTLEEVPLPKLDPHRLRMLGRTTKVSVMSPAHQNLRERIQKELQPGGALARGEPDFSLEQVANLRRVRGSPKKHAEVARLVSGMFVHEAVRQLMFTKRRVARKYLSAVRGAADSAIKKGMHPELLYLHVFNVTQATSIKRMQTHARSRFGALTHRYSHLRIVIRQKRKETREDIHARVIERARTRDYSRPRIFNDFYRRID